MNNDLIKRLRERARDMAECAGMDPINEQLDTLSANEIERLRDKIDGLEADLNEAIRVAWTHGAVEWVKLNYPDWQPE